MSRDVREPEDFTENGKCSRCGNCCASILPLSGADVKRLRKFAKKKNIVPALPEGDDVIYLHCPFLADDPLLPGKKKCLCYEVRPRVCRTFSCAGSNRDNAKAWLERFPGEPLPEPVNAWLVFGRTGLKAGGREIPYNAAPRCRVGCDDGTEYEFAVGRPVSFDRADGTTVPPSLVLNISEAGLQIFNAGARRVETVAFADIAEILSESCIISDERETEDNGHDAERP